MTFKNQRTAYFSLRALTSYKNEQQDLKGYCTKFTKFLPDVEESSSMLMQQSALRYSLRCWMLAHRMKTGCVNFRQHAPHVGYHSNAPWASRRNQNPLLWSRLIPLYFLKVLQRSITGGNVGNVRILVMCAVCTHPPMQMSNKISAVTEPKFTTFLPDEKKSSSMLMQQSACCGISIRCKMPVQTIKAEYANLSPSRATKLVAMATSLNWSSPNS